MKPVNIFLISIVLLFSASCSQHDQATAPSSSTVRVDNILLLDALLAGSRVIAAGERGQIIYSDDKGGTWKRARVPVQATLTALFFIDDTHGWAAGHDSVILRTIDGGENWEQTHSAPQQEAPLLDIWFSDRTKGFAVGAYGQFYATMDGGRTWKKKSAITSIRSREARGARSILPVKPARCTARSTAAHRGSALRLPIGGHFLAF